MKNKKRGQAALEFLMTYGWAFLVILIVIGAFVYFDVLNPAKLVPARCSFPAGFSCPEFGVNEDEAQFVLVNRQGFSIEFIHDSEGDHAVTLLSTGTAIQREHNCTLPNVNVNQRNGVLFNLSSDRLIEGQALLFECDLDDLNIAAGERYQGDIIIKFQRAGGAIPQQARGSLGVEVTPS